MSGDFGIAKDWVKHWRGMLAFGQRNLMPSQTIKVHFRSPEDRKLFSELTGRSLSEKTISIWYPKEEIAPIKDRRWTSENPLQPRYPVYVISKGRWESRLTSKVLERMKVPYHIVVEPQEYDDYAAVIDPKKILLLPFSNLGKGSIPARNWVWEHSLEAGDKRHWILDDNILHFYRCDANQVLRVVCGNIFRAAEDFADRYENMAIAGFQYYMFLSRKTVVPPFVFNTRVYSCILIQNDISYRWRGMYNEDTDLSLRVLKDGWCTVLFNAFLAQKMPTMTMKGGNTEALYKDDGRWKMARSLEKQHPDIVKITRKWGRWQHQVDYSRFSIHKKNKLKLRRDAFVSDEIDNYGMYLEVDDEGTRHLFDNRLLLIGQAPGRAGDSSDPLGGKIGKRLSKLVGMEYEQFAEVAELTNLFDEWPGKDGKGDVWDVKKGRQAAEKLKPSLQNRRVLFVGRNVAEAFVYKDLPFLEWSDCDFAAEVAVIPHPSGIVRWWNDTENKRSAGEFLKSSLGLCNEGGPG